ncbi:hypothetical protein FOA43_001851 [Brettanomyces nanus]|uniref:RRM domain-containing protein n=1 Tax=Eeniella nana TaxID=13502 RepID=A0A875RYC8_EENNA|nr:uncharacterized protein FOA43_001851 [Brettanomyces nanus]QPG74521.1 hypothetical protein FOA43_001851 [Brettanomyces nanus]
MSIVSSGIPFSTPDEKVEEFFTFCGKVKSIEVIDKNEKSKTVEVEFVNPSAVSTALLLNGAELNGSTIEVKEKTAKKSDEPPTYSDATKATQSSSSESGDIAQEEKPKTTIAAEYLANGYVLSDKLVQGAIEFDKKHGFSGTFRSFLKGVDDKYHLHAKGQEVNTKLGLEEKLDQGRRTLDSYLDKFKKDKYGSKINQFYTNVATDVTQVHEEAKRIAAEREKKAEGFAGSPVIDPTINTIGPNSTTAQAAGAVAFEEDKK